MAIVEYENWTSSGATNHRVMRMGHVQPWRGWAENNRLETTWNAIPQGKAGGPKPFPTEEKPIGSGTSKDVKLTWKVWDDSNKLTNNELELYSVMRAERRYIGEGYKKLASKYVNTVSSSGGSTMTVENCGVDSFFWRNSDQSCVFCESKFTTNMRIYARWRRNPRSVWQRLGRYEANGRPCRQMSWEWIGNRASEALRNPAGLQGLPTSQKASIIEESVRMLRAAIGRRGRRVVNIYGAAQVPVYPGVYLFVLGEGGTPSVNELSIEWPFPQDPQEFIELGQDFEDWLQRQPSHVSSPPPSPIISR
ncbi:hypothetical protein [Vitiosangium sp. GDMCC 1.1324]|uniref:hypothetical protein n=1 Tax=Vitiosangium sp. (strain GDMCC 1.1324) TaxID=2138576 RepID=UPI000D3898CF|nr:hypothetical protein [Vitiosangium sp. GDMCC 1.1324]PTL76531.1 hypothetical protein DAT35_48820 [Vitiosangium sp. GDMCC 1.1324]